MRFTRHALLAGLAASLSLGAARAAPLQIALTFDDLPAHSALPPGESRVDIAGRLLAAFHDASAPAFGFINGVQIEREPASEPVLSLWRAAGQPLGNHTWSHLDLKTLTPEQFEAELVRNEPLLTSLAKKGGAGGDWRWLRFPFLSEGDTPEKRAAVRAILAKRHYRIASVTLSFDDYAWNEPYARCRTKGDDAAIAALEASYMQAAADSLARARALSAQVNGGDIPYVLLMHAGAFDARMAPRLLAYYQSAGVRFVSLDQAERHPFYRADYKTLPAPAPLTLELAAAARGLPIPARTWDIRALAEVCR